MFWQYSNIAVFTTSFFWKNYRNLLHNYIIFLSNILHNHFIYEVWMAMMENSGHCPKDILVVALRAKEQHMKGERLYPPLQKICLHRSWLDSRRYLMSFRNILSTNIFRGRTQKDRNWALWLCLMFVNPARKVGEEEEHKEHRIALNLRWPTSMSLQSNI